MSLVSAGSISLDSTFNVAFAEIALSVNAPTLDDISPREREEKLRESTERHRPACRCVKNRICFNNKDDLRDGGL